MDKDIAVRMNSAIRKLLIGLANGKFRHERYAYISEAEFLESPEIGELAAASDAWTSSQKKLKN